MKTFYLNAKYSGKVNFPKGLLNILPEKIVLFTSVQFIHLINNMRVQLENFGREVFVEKSSHTCFRGQLLGCNIEKINSDADAFLYVGDGNFHPFALLYGNDKQVFQYDPFSKKYFEVDKSLIQKNIRKNNAFRAEFLMKNVIGVLISTKYGQNFSERAFSLKFLFPEKKFYFFVFDTLDFSQLENFPFVEVFVNTACPRIGLDDQNFFTRPVVNLQDVEFLAENR